MRRVAFWERRVDTGPDNIEYRIKERGIRLS